VPIPQSGDYGSNPYASIVSVITSDYDEKFHRGNKIAGPERAFTIGCSKSDARPDTPSACRLNIALICRRLMHWGKTGWVAIYKETGEPGWDRTIDTLIKSQVLYH
jgi:hypothetical protein